MKTKEKNHQNLTTWKEPFLTFCIRMLFSLPPSHISESLTNKILLFCQNTFSSPVGTAEFSKFAGILSAALSQYHLLGK